MRQKISKSEPNLLTWNLGQSFSWVELMGFLGWRSSMPKYCSKNRLWSTVSNRKMIFRPTTRVQLNLAKEYWWWLVMKEAKHILTWCGKHLQHVSALETIENFQHTKGTSHWDLWTWNIPKTPLDLKWHQISLTNYTKLYDHSPCMHLVSICCFHLVSRILTSTFRIIFFSQSFTNLGGSADLILSRCCGCFLSSLPPLPEVPKLDLRSRPELRSGTGCVFSCFC